MTVVEREGRRIAALVHDAAVADDPALVSGTVAAAGLALENARLHAEVRAQLEELRASRRRLDWWNISGPLVSGRRRRSAAASPVTATMSMMPSEP